MLSHATTATTFSTYAPAMDVRPLHSTMVLHPNCIIPQAHLPGLRQHASRGPHDSISLAQSTDSVYGAILFWAVRCTPHGSHRLRTSCRSLVSITCAALTRSRASSVGDALNSVTMVCMASCSGGSACGACFCRHLCASSLCSSPGYLSQST